jgi:hypothetical protein
MRLLIETVKKFLPLAVIAGGLCALVFLGEVLWRGKRS